MIESVVADLPELPREKEAALEVKPIHRQLLTGENTYATTLLVLVTDAYGVGGGEGCESWDPETLLMQIEEDFGVKLPQQNFDKLQTALQLITGEDFYKALPDFITYCNVLNGDLFDPRTWDPADATEIAWGVTEALLISPPEEDEPFTDEIRSYIGEVLDAEGIMQPPDILRLALRGSDPAATVQAEFTDDPDMFASIYEFEQGKTDSINQYVRGHLGALSTQLASLPLRGGDATDAVQRLIGALSPR